MTADSPSWEPPMAGTDAEHLVGSLERLRATFRWKADGLDLAGLQAQIPSSDLSLGGLLKHLAVCEDDIFSWKFAGQQPTARTLIPDGVDEDEWQFTVDDDETREQVYALWDDAVGRSRARLHEALADGGLDQKAHLGWDGQHVSLRRLVCDLIEEYGRHTGHADLLREALDGRVGEDPPLDWRSPLEPTPEH